MNTEDKKERDVASDLVTFAVLSDPKLFVPAVQWHILRNPQSWLPLLFLGWLFDLYIRRGAKKLQAKQDAKADAWIRIFDGIDPLPDEQLLRHSPTTIKRLFPVNQQRYAQLIAEAANPKLALAAAPSETTVTAVSTLLVILFLGLIAFIVTLPFTSDWITEPKNWPF